MKRANLTRFKRVINKYKHISCDSMIFSYYFYGEHPYAELSEAIIEFLTEERMKVTTSIISYLETLSYPDLENNLDKLGFIKSFFLNQRNLQIEDLNVELADTASFLRRRHRLSAPDSVQYAAALKEGAEIVITNDEHYKKLIDKEDISIIFLDDYIH